MQHLALDHAEQDRLAILAKGGDRKAAGLLVQSMAKWINTLAKRKAGYRKGMIEDLEAEGYQGIMLAIQNYTLDSGTSFYTFATFQVKARMTRYIHVNARSMNMGKNVHARKLWSKLPEIRRQCVQERIACTPQVVADRSGVSLDHVIPFMRAVKDGDLYLDAGNDRTGGGAIDLPVAPEIEDLDFRLRVTEEVTAFGQTLTGRDAEIFYLRIATDDETETLEEIGIRHGVSRERIRQIESRIRRKLRKWIEEKIPETHQILHDAVA